MVFWPCWTAAVGYLAARTPDTRFASDDWVTRPRKFEDSGRWYRDRLQINRWKDRLPEAGAAFGGITKRSMAAVDRPALERFELETRRAEHAHWGMAAGVVFTALWNPWWGVPVNALVAFGSNAPCIAVQRYNRARLQSVLRRRSNFTSDQ